MKNYKSRTVRNTTRYYCLVYLVMTVLFHVFLPVVQSVPFLAITGAHAPYYFLLFAMLLLETSYVSPGGILGGTLLATELFFLTALMVVSVMAFWKKKYFPFWTMSVLSNAFTIGTVIFAFCLNSDAVILSADLMCSMIGNAVFGYVFYRKMHMATGN